ncbi:MULTISPECIES: sulfurtransferase TusA family protein [Vibrio]|uniref:sulfurtransferase TusA family protein n=1 Tax=Vibrio TaxID=662 RepID=UPI001E52C449|nr:hypothetical protein [Vibrio lentus]MCC4837983.1 hypothetical protein [Vibrio lentus]
MSKQHNVDCMGLICPESILILKQAVRAAQSGDIIIYKNDQPEVLPVRINQYGTHIQSLKKNDTGEDFFKVIDKNTYSLEVA